jgi:hypothetical protein
MQIEDIGEVIAERALKRTLDGVESKDVIVRLGCPKAFAEGSDYYCPFEILGLGDRKVRYAAGVDAFHSLQLVFRMISADLHHYMHGPSVELHWLEAGDDLGFPDVS